MSESPSAALIDKCVHCGFCLPTCPTYMLWGEEMDSPRGRIYLMKAALEGRAAIDATYVRHIDACLGCLNCVTACPSGVQYGPLIERTRAQIEQQYTRSFGDRLFRGVLLWLIPYPARMRVALMPLALLGGLARAFAASAAGRWLPERARAALALAPPVSLRSLFKRLPERTAAAGAERQKVAVLSGCVQRLAFADVNEATIRVLAADGCSVAVPSGQGCCGALALHAGQIEQARGLARRTIEVFERAGVDRVIVNAAGCGSAMKEYGDLFAGDTAWGERARAFSTRVRDISEMLVELGSRAPRQPIRARVVYHDACHLAHGQGIRSQPRTLLQEIPGLELVSPPEADICCGSAGIYNLVQPEPAAQLGARKAANIAAMSPDMIATGNPGCILQIASAGRARGQEWAIVHPIQLIDASIRGEAALPRVSKKTQTS
ncbi:MAG TPA: heterodisulfide reductase-related iron-sulfur binding cluster [Vicinamibacterales bacterium]|nr:heterodisulfide reductase-related iron-sulfur binding cluster [Vicinamibacterales bacterium]